ncbi:hypothetical protein L0244_06950 [bacterium]|nr:hypothetical protein [bacterium]
MERHYGPDRDVKVYHALQKGRVWHGFIVSDIAEKVSDAKEFRNGLNDLLAGTDLAPIEDYKGAVFIRGPYDPKTLASLKEYFARHLPAGSLQELQGDYFNFSSRYHFWELIDSQQPASTKK